LDDPFLPSASVPMGSVSANPWLLGAIQQGGGHVGFVEESPPWRPRFWAEAEAARYLAAILGNEGSLTTSSDPDFGAMKSV
jgi:predicted alpha/beta-fold hydrolase